MAIGAKKEGPEKRKEESEKRKTQLKILVTEEEYEKIDNYARRYFQSKSDFIRSAILERILQFDRLTLPQKSDPRFSEGNIPLQVRKDLKEKLSPDEENQVQVLKKPDGSELARGREQRAQGRQEVEKESKNIKKQMKE